MHRHRRKDERRMRCSSCKKLLDRYVEGTVSTRQIIAISSHIRSCASCAAILEELRTVDGLLATMKAPDPAINFTFAVMAEVRSMPAPRAQRANTFAFIGGYLVIAWLIIAGWLRLENIDYRFAASTVWQSLGSTFATLNHSTGALMRSFGGGAPIGPAFVAGVLALDLAVFGGILLVYGVVRPRLAAHLASSSEGRT